MPIIIKGTLQNNTKSFSIKWEIDRFFADCQKVDDCYKSPEFSLRYANNITKWRLKVYPKGNGVKYKDYVSLYLGNATENSTELTVDYKLSIVSKKSSVPFHENEETHTYPLAPQNWGWHAFIEQSVLKSDILIDDTLTILCEITFHPLGQDNVGNFDGYDKWIEKIGYGVGDCGLLLESGNFSDVTFIVQEEKIKSHKAILSCRSPVFKAMFEHDMKENKQSAVDITDMNYDVMKEVFRFIYSGKVENIDKIASDLLIAADKYQVIELKALCEKTLYNKLTVANAVEYLRLSSLCETIHLKRLVIKFITAHSKEVIKNPGFKDLNSCVMFEVMQAIVEKD